MLSKSAAGLATLLSQLNATLHQGAFAGAYGLLTGACALAGLVSLSLLDQPLLGPPHMHMRPPMKSHFIGELSPQGSPLHYLACLRSLHQGYRQHCTAQQEAGLPAPPLVINTQGWIKASLAIPCDIIPDCCRLEAGRLSCVVLCQPGAEGTGAVVQQSCRPLLHCLPPAALLRPEVLQMVP